MNQNSSFALAREWVIGIVLAFIIPFTTYYSADVFLTYIKKMPDVDVRYNKTLTDQERENRWDQRDARHTELKKLLFYTSLIVGLAAIILGNFVLHPSLALTIGLSIGGLFTLIMGYFFYWDQFGLLFKFGSLLLTMILLFFIALYRLKK